MSTTHGLSKADQALIDLVRDRLRGNTALHEATKRLLQENELSLDTPESSHLSLLENARQDRRYSQNNVVASGSSVSKHASSDIEVSSPTPTGFLNLPLEFRQMVYGYFGVCCTLVKQSFLIANCVRSGKNVAFMPICHQFVVDDIGTCVRSNSSISKTVDLPTVSALLATCRTTHADLDAALPNSPLMSIRVPNVVLPRDMETLGLCAGGLPVSRFDCFSISFVDTLIRQSCYFELSNNINHILWYLSQSVMHIEKIFIFLPRIDESLKKPKAAGSNFARKFIQLEVDRLACDLLQHIQPMPNNSGLRPEIVISSLDSGVVILQPQASIKDNLLSASRAIEKWMVQGEGGTGEIRIHRDTVVKI